MPLKNILEQREDLNVFKRLLYVFNAYCEKFPGTAVEVLLKGLMEKGIKCLPKDAIALKVLSYMLDKQLPDASKVGEIMNFSFIHLPLEARPVFDSAGVEEVAYWKRGDKVYDRVMSLINLDDSSKGSWCDKLGNAVKLLNIKGE